MFKRTLALHIACAIFLSPVFILGENNQDITLAGHIKDKYLTSTFGNAETTTPTATPAIDPNAGFFEKFQQQIDPKTQLLTPREAQEIAFNITSSIPAAPANSFKKNIFSLKWCP